MNQQDEMNPRLRKKEKQTKAHQLKSLSTQHTQRGRNQGLRDSMIGLRYLTE